MSCKSHNSGLKSTCSCSKKYSASLTSDKSIDRKKCPAPRKLVPSRKLSSKVPQDGKSGSAGLIDNIKKNTVVKTKKATQSDNTFLRNNTIKEQCTDFCTRCGDIIIREPESVAPEYRKKYSLQKLKSQPMKKSQSVQQYYKNENFAKSAFSINDSLKKLHLDTINEQSETQTEGIDHSNVIICSDTDDEPIGYLDTDSDKSLKRLKEFRQKNYFECHSAKSRIDNRGSAISLQEHKCVYRFYLNDRLFPVPLSTDHKNQIRCVECHLPLESVPDSSTNMFNGAIQAKAKLGTSVKDMLVLLPVKEPLVIKERRKEYKKGEPDVVYFGVIKLDNHGQSMFTQNLPSNSLALKYQRGYQEFENIDQFTYKSDENKEEVIII